MAAFSACVALAPDSPWCVYNRGLGYTQTGRLDQAMADFDRALALDSATGGRLPGRAAVHQRAGRFQEALADLGRAADAGLPRPTMEYQKALVNLAAQDRRAAIASLRDCLTLDPGHADARDLLARLSRN